MAPCVGLIAEVGDKQDSENGTCNSPSSYIKYRQGHLPDIAMVSNSRDWSPASCEISVNRP